MRKSVLQVTLVLLLCAAGATAATPSAAATGLASKEIAKLDLQGISLQRVLQFLHDVTGANIQPDWAALKEVGVTQDSPTKVTGTGIALSRALDVSLAGVAEAKEPLAWYIDGNVFHVSTQKNALAARRNQPMSQLTAARPARVGTVVTKVDFQDIPLSEALEFLRALSGLNFAINWNSLATVGVDQATTITAQANDVSLWKALDMVLAQVNVGKNRLDTVYWNREDNIVTITTGAELDRQLIVRVYDVADLLMVVPNFAGPRLALGQSNASRGGNGNNSGGGQQSGLFGGSGNTGQTGSGQTGSGQTGEEVNPAEQREQLRNGLVQAVQATTGAELWQPLGRGTITFLGGKMIISQTALGYKLMGQSFRAR